MHRSKFNSSVIVSKTIEMLQRTDINLFIIIEGSYIHKINKIWIETCTKWVSKLHIMITSSDVSVRCKVTMIMKHQSNLVQMLAVVTESATAWIASVAMTVRCCRHGTGMRSMSNLQKDEIKFMMMYWM